MIAICVLFWIASLLQSCKARSAQQSQGGQFVDQSRWNSDPIESLQEGKRGGDDWRGDACARAGIPWLTFTDRVRLSSGMLARVFTRSDNLQYLESDTRVMIKSMKEAKHGDQDEDQILVEFRVFVSDDSVQKSISLTQSRDDVALIIDGTGIGTPEARECVMATVVIYLPTVLHHLIVDVDHADITVQKLFVWMHTLELQALSGAIAILDSLMSLTRLHVAMDHGTFQTTGGVEAHEQDVFVKTGSIRGDLTLGHSTMIHVETGFVDIHSCAIPEIPSLGRESRTVEIHNREGNVHLTVSDQPDLKVSVLGDLTNVTIQVPETSSAAIALATRNGSIAYPSSLTIVTDHRGSVSRKIIGYLGDGTKKGPELTSTVVTGSLSLVSI